MRRATPQELRLLARALGQWRPYLLPGGIPAKRRLRPQQFDRDQLAIGTRVELEHTRRPAVAMEIAMAHLAESRGYYAALEAMERKFARMGLYIP